MVRLHSNGERRPFRRQTGRVRRRFSAQERLDIAAVRKIGACKVCKLKKTKCRHTVRYICLATDTTSTSISTSSYRSPATEVCQPLVQVSNTSATRSARVETSTGPSPRGTNLKPLLSGHTYLNTTPPSCMNEPVTFGFGPACDDRHATSSWKSDWNLIPDTIHNMDYQSSLNSPTDHSFHSLHANEHWQILDTFDTSEDVFAMERINRPSVDKKWTQHPIVWPAGVEPQFGHAQVQSHSQASYTGSQSYFSQGYTFPPESSCSLADSVASTMQWNEYAIQHARMSFGKEEFIDGGPLQFQHQWQKGRERANFWEEPLPIECSVV